MSGFGYASTPGLVGVNGHGHVPQVAQLPQLGDYQPSFDPAAFAQDSQFMYPDMYSSFHSMLNGLGGLNGSQSFAQQYLELQQQHLDPQLQHLDHQMQHLDLQSLDLQQLDQQALIGGNHTIRKRRGDDSGPPGFGAPPGFEAHPRQSHAEFYDPNAFAYPPSSFAPSATWGDGSDAKLGQDQQYGTQGAGFSEYQYATGHDYYGAAFAPGFATTYGSSTGFGWQTYPEYQQSLGQDRQERQGQERGHLMAHQEQ
jgi:hypothetical protein